LIRQGEFLIGAYVPVGIEDDVTVPVRRKADLVQRTVFEHSVNAACRRRDPFIYRGPGGGLGSGDIFPITAACEDSTAHKS
jgi:hypothetical protein